MITGRLENWTKLGSCLCGDIHNDLSKRWPDGTPVRTSRLEPPEQVLLVDAVVTTMNSSYLLGLPA